MPFNNVPDEYQDKMHDCVMKLKDEGKDEESAVAICYAAIVEGKSAAREAVKAAGFILDNDITLDLEKTVVHAGGAVKALPGGKVGGYLITYGGIDLTGQYFAKDTDYGEPNRLPVMYHHGMDDKLQRRRIGTAEIKRDEFGLWAEAQLQLRDEYEKMVYELAQKGKLGWSSGAAAHAVTVVPEGKAEKITQWYLAEASLTPSPAEPRNMVIPLKSLMGVNTANGQGAGEAQNSTAAADKSINSKGDIKMDELETKVQAAVKAALDEQAAKAAEQKAEQERVEKLAEEKAEKKLEAFKAEVAKSRRLPDGVPYVTKFADTGIYDGLDAGAQAVLIGTLQSAKKNVNQAAFKALCLKLGEDKSEIGHEGMKALRMAGMAVKADELDYSTLSSYGDEWVGVAYSQAIWDAIRVGTFVLNKIPQVEVPQGFESIYLPLESTDPTWYKVGETTVVSASYGTPAPTVTASNLGTGRVQLTLNKMGARVMWSGELEESSLIPFASQLRTQLGKSGAEYLEAAIIDGDTSTTSSENINNAGGAITTGAYYLMFDGFRMSPLVTTTANSRSAAGSLDITDYIETVKLMGGAGINALDRSKVSFIVDPNTYYKTLQLPEILTRDSFASPTLENGQLTGLWGYGLDVSGQMHKSSSVRKANTAGYVNTTDTSANLYGAILAVRWDQWKFGWRRRMTMETTRFANADVNEITAMVRVGLIQRDTEAAAISYYVGV